MAAHDLRITHDYGRLTRKVAEKAHGCTFTDNSECLIHFVNSSGFGPIRPMKSGCSAGKSTHRSRIRRRARSSRTELYIH